MAAVYLRVGEELEPEVLASPPPCFRPAEWEKYARSVANGGALAPSVGQRKALDPVTRQVRALRVQACRDCTVAYQLGQTIARVAGGPRCQPVERDLTPVARTLRGDDEDDDPIEERNERQAEVGRRNVAGRWAARVPA